MSDLGILGAIVARKRLDVAERLRGVSLADLRERATPTRLSLGAALARPDARFLMEVKRASPSEGTLRDGVDPARQARAYLHAADAVSVLIDMPCFGGSLDDLAAVRAASDQLTEQAPEAEYDLLLSFSCVMRGLILGDRAGAENELMRVARGQHLGIVANGEIGSYRQGAPASTGWAYSIAALGGGGRA